MAGLKRWKRSRQWQEEDGKFILYAVRFLKKERWKAISMGLQPTEAGQGEDQQMVTARLRI